MEDILRALSTYGFPIVLSGLMLYMAFRFGIILLTHYEQKLDHKNHNELALLRNQISLTIETLLERAVLKSRASRVYIFEFHNGVTPLGGLPFLKMTNTYEALGKGAKSELHRRENMPMQLFSSFVKAIYEKDCVVMDTENKSDEYSAMVWATLEERDVGVAVCAKVTGLNGKIIGYLGFDFCKGNDFNRDTVYDAIKIVQDVAAEVGALLSVDKRK